MNKIYTKHHLLDFINPEIEVENKVNPIRTYAAKNESKNINNEIICLLTRTFRVEDNFTLNFAVEKANEFNSKLKILVFLDKEQVLVPNKKEFLKKNLEIFKQNLNAENLDFEYVFDTKQNLLNKIKKINPSLIVHDFNPLFKFKTNTQTIEVDSFNIVPARFADDTQAYSAASLRRKIYNTIYEFLTELPQKNFKKNEGYELLEDFITSKLSEYAPYKNNPNMNAVSKLSPYINWGFLSSQHIALEVIKSDNSKENKETFLEELVIRKELADNFCLYTKDFKSFASLPNWAKLSLNQHKPDLRNFLYSIDELENSKTADALWNASQNQLKREGKIHGYMRMYWAKMILYWSISAEEAIEKAIYLNDKYAFDAPSCNGYTGILWAIGGLHDRPFQDRLVSGKIRTMTYNGAKHKFDVNEYINKYS